MTKLKGEPSEAETVASIMTDIYRLNGLFRRRRNILAEEVGQTQARWQVLSAASDGDRTVAQIGRRLKVSRQNVQRIADLLRADELVHYVYNQDHERSPLVQLTPEGVKSLATLAKTAETFHAELAEGLSLNELENARIVLMKFAIQLERDLMTVEEIPFLKMAERGLAAAMRGKSSKPR